MESLLREAAHRPWPIPEDRPWIMTQDWQDLLFAHWPVAAPGMRALVPEELTLDLYRGQAYVAVTPFRIRELRPGGVSVLPLASSFLELNVRTYVSFKGRPGVHFFSLDAASLAAIWGARIFYRLPYWKAAMKAAEAAGSERIDFRSRRTHGPRPAEFEATYGPTGPAAAPQAGSLEHFLTERYCLYTVTRKSRAVYRAEIHHLPWPLQPATAEIRKNSMAEIAGIHLPDAPPLLHFARELRVLVWAPERVG
jgi:uncharacterized protein YqjF (DUF2071 family)